MGPIPITNRDKAFLEKVRDRAKLPDLFDARNITVVVFQALRGSISLASMETSARTISEVHGGATPKRAPLPDRTEAATLWKEADPVTIFLRWVCPPFELDADAFLKRMPLEADLPDGVTAEMAIAAVFAATKDELSMDYCQEIASCLAGKVRELWMQS